MNQPDDMEKRFEIFYFQNEEPHPWPMGLSKEKIFEFVRSERSLALKEGEEKVIKELRKIRKACTDEQFGTIDFDTLAEQVLGYIDSLK